MVHDILEGADYAYAPHCFFRPKDIATGADLRCSRQRLLTVRDTSTASFSLSVYIYMCNYSTVFAYGKLDIIVMTCICTTSQDIRL